MPRSTAPSTPSIRSSMRRSSRAVPGHSELGGAAITLGRQPDWRRLAVEPILLVRQGAPRLLGAPEMVLCRVIGGPLGKPSAGHRILQQGLRLLHGKSSSEHDPEKACPGGMACRMAIQRYFRDHFAMLMN